MPDGAAVVVPVACVPGFVWPPRCGGAYGSGVGAGQVPVGGGADPQQDAGPQVDEGPPAGALAPVVVAAQGREVARAGGSAQMVGHGVVEVALDGRPPTPRKHAPGVSGVDGSSHGGRGPVPVVPVHDLPGVGGVGGATGDLQGGEGLT